MASIGTVYPYGLRDVKITLFASPGTQVDLPAAISLKFSEVVNTAELKGDDALQAVHSVTEKVEWELSAGGISLDAWALLTGRTVTNSGSTPNRVDTLLAKSDDAFPYLKIYGKAVGADGGDVHCKLFKCKITKTPEGTFQGGEFFQTGISGIAIPDAAASNQVYAFVYNETAANLPIT